MAVQDFMDGVVFGWIKHDVERMRDEIKVHPGKAGNINFPLALCLLAYMEYLGGFLLGKDGGFARNVDFKKGT